MHASLREGLARALPQALIAGKPVISYDVDGAREVVVSGETGYLLAPRSVEPLADALVTLADSRELRQRLGHAGRERCTDQFRHETMTRQLRELYQRLAAAGGGAGTAGERRSSACAGLAVDWRARGPGRYLVTHPLAGASQNEEAKEHPWLVVESFWAPVA